MDEKDLAKIFLKVMQDPEFEATFISKRPLRGRQIEMINRVENHIINNKGCVMPILSSRQTGKTEISAVLQRRHLMRNKLAPLRRSYVRTAPTYDPQIVVAKRRLDEVLKLNKKNISAHPMFFGNIIQKSEGFIYKYGSATVEFLSSGPHANVVGSTASELLDLDEAHKVSQAKMDEDFLPMTASTNAPTIMWGVAADGLDAMEFYRQHNIERGRPDLNLYYPCEMWMDDPIYKAHIDSRVQALGWEHAIIKTQYRLIPVSQEGTFLSKNQVMNLFDSNHSRQMRPRDGVQYEMLIDVAAGNEEFNPDQMFDKLDTDSNETTATDSTVVWIYEVTGETASNNIYPICNIVQLYHWTGLNLPNQELELTRIIQFWKVNKITIDGVGVGRHLAESLEAKFGVYAVNKYIATSASISEDCFDLHARLNYGAVKMFKDDSSSEYAEFERQVAWTKYASDKGKMTLVKPKSDKHIDMVKALTYINRNKPANVAHQILSVESSYE